MLPVRAQGRRQSCLAFAGSAAHEHRLTSLEHLSAEHLYYHSVARMPVVRPGAGTSMQAFAAAIQADGQPVELAWPYSPVQPDPWTVPVITSTIFKASASVGALTFDQIVSELTGGKPVVLGLIVSEAFYRPDATGRVAVRMPDPNRAGHAVLAVGCSDPAAPDAALLVRNSWGPAWGIGGYGWVPRAYVNRQLRETAVLG